MKRTKIVYLILIICMAFTVILSACTNAQPSTGGNSTFTDSGTDAGANNGQNNSDTNNSEGETMTIEVKIGNTTLTAELEDNSTARAFRALLPMTLPMTELNGNEKYHNLASPIATNTERVGRVEAGDIMLFGNNCVVLFYESFQTSYSYSRIGKISSGDIKSLVGEASVTVEFLLKNKE